MVDETKARKPFPAALAHLKNVKAWLVWRYVTDEKTGKVTKVPFQPRAPDYRASNKKPEHWSKFAVARAVVKAGKADGVGFVVKGSMQEVWIDLDDCRNPKTGAIAEWAQRFVDMAGSYTEITPSKGGLRIVGYLAGALSGKPIHKAFKLTGGHKGEIFYRATRYVTLTGDRLPDAPDTLNPVDETVSMILRENTTAKDDTGSEDSGEIGDVDDLVGTLDARPLNLSTEQITGYLSNLPPADHTEEDGSLWWTYNKFMAVVFAVHDETDGTDEGFELLDEWAQTTPHYEAEGLRKKWDSARGSHTGEPRVSFKVIIKWANEHTAPQRRQELDELINEIVQARSINELEDAQKKAQELKVDSPGLRAVLVAQYRAAFRRITGMNIGESKAHALLAFRDPMLTEMPDWLRSFCWVSGRGEFYDAQTGQLYSPQVFDITFGRRFMSDEEISQGNDAPAVVPSRVVVTRYQIPVVAELGYRPVPEKRERSGDELEGADDVALLRRPRVYTRDGVRYVNRYHSRGAVPANYGPWTKEQKDDIRTLKALYARVCGNERDTAIFLSTLRYAVVEKKRAKFCPVLMGAERSGKTTAAVTVPTLLLGEENVGIYGPTVILDKTDGSWKDGHLWKVIEELWVPDYAKAAVIEGMKPCVTNSLVPARFMFKGARQVENTATYIGLTNHDDVLALTSADTRFYPICNERTATRRSMDALIAEDPGFYDRVFLAIERSVGAFKGWLETRFTYHEDFHPETGRAPESSVKERIIDLGRDELTQDILDVLDAAPTPLLTRDVVCVTSLRNYLLDQQKQITHSGDRKRASEVLGAALRKLDMRPRGRFRLPCVWNAESDDDPLAGGGKDNRTRIYTSGTGPLDIGDLTTDRVIEYERYGDL